MEIRGCFVAKQCEADNHRQLENHYSGLIPSMRLRLGKRLVRDRTICNHKFQLFRSDPKVKMSASIQDDGVFIAFASRPEGLVEILQSAVETYKGMGLPLDLFPWTDLEVSGDLIWRKVLQEIDRRPYFVADVSTLNPNVTYEMGYAIGKRRKIRFILNEDLKDTKERDRIGIFDVLGYSGYRTAKELLDFFSQSVDSAKAMFVDDDTDKAAPIFLFDAYEKTELVNHIKTSVKKLLVRFRSYDPQEQARLPVHEAIRAVALSEGIVVSLVPPKYQGAELHNFRAAFVAGLSHGMDKKLCIVQIGDEATPLDFRDFTDQCFSKDHIEKAIERFTLGVTPRLQSRVHKERNTNRSLLELLNLGGSVAENEMQSIDEYYLDTDAYLRTHQGEVRLIIGRKGSGKTALFVRLRNSKRRRKQNVVVDLKPEGFKLLKFKERIVDALSEGTLRHVVSAIWEYVLLLEIAYKILENDRDIHARDLKLSQKYDVLRSIYEQDEFYSEGDFSERVSVLLDDIGEKISAEQIDGSAAILGQKKISELIYKHPIRQLHDCVADYLKDKGEAWVLIDNLDKGWPSTGVTKGDVTLIICLLEALEKITRSLRRQGYTQFFSTVFLRADVYDNLIDTTSDRGKVLPVSVDWSDPSALKELIRKRLVYSDFSNEHEIEHLWEQISIPTTDQGNTLDLLIQQSLYRPRALLDLIAACKSIAVNRRHSKISEEDLQEAMRRSSFQMIENINLELRDVNPSLDQLVYSFMGREPSMNRSELRKILKKTCQDTGADETEKSVIDLLLWFGFFGIGEESGGSTYIFDVNYNMNMIRALATTKGLSARFVIHPAFRPSLAIADSSQTPRIRLL